MSTELPVERRLKKGVEQLGGRCIKLIPWFTKGLPDRLALLPGGRVWFVETKAPKTDGTLRPGQRRWRDTLTGLGMNWCTLATREAVDRWLLERRDET